MLLAANKGTSCKHVLFVELGKNQNFIPTENFVFQIPPPIPNQKCTIFCGMKIFESLEEPKWNFLENFWIGKLAAQLDSLSVRSPESQPACLPASLIST